MLYTTNSNIHGYGNFASRAIAMGTTVAKMDFYNLRGSFNRFPGLRDEQFIVVIDQKGNNYYVTDINHTHETPQWFYFNHSSQPNLDMKWTGTNIEWVARKDIMPGWELTFNYGPEGCARYDHDCFAYNLPKRI